MDQQKIGEFLKTLRKDKNLTQEELADKMNVSRRTVSRWETGSNLPDLSILVELADLYDVDMREIFNGERKNETMDKDLKETMLMAADYTDDNMKKVMKRMQLMFIGATVCGALYILLASVAPEPVEEFATCCRINHKRSCHYDCSCCRSDLYSQFTYLRFVFFSHYGFLPREILVRENVICHTICDVVEFFYADIANEIVFV